MDKMTKKFNELTEELKSMFTVSQAMAKNSFDSTLQSKASEFTKDEITITMPFSLIGNEIFEAKGHLVASCWRNDIAEILLDILNSTLTKLREVPEQPPAGEFTVCKRCTNWFCANWVLKECPTVIPCEVDYSTKMGQSPAKKFTRRIRWTIKDMELGKQPGRLQWMDKDDALEACDIIDSAEASKADLLEALKRVYFLLEINNIRDEYFEALRLKLGDLLSSQVVSKEKMEAAIAKGKKKG